MARLQPLREVLCEKLKKHPTIRVFPVYANKDNDAFIGVCQSCNRWWLLNTLEIREFAKNYNVRHA